MVISARLLIFVLVLAGWTADLAAQAPSVPARLSLEMLSGGARLRLDADDFCVVADPSQEGARNLLPKRFRVTITGENRASYTVSGESEAPDGWLSRHEIALCFDEQIEGQLVAPVEPDGGDVLRSAPVRVAVGPGDEPLIEVFATSPPADPAWRITRRGKSVRTEAAQTRTLQEGRWLEKPPTSQKNVLTPRYHIVLGSGIEGSAPRHGRLDGPRFVFEDEDLRVPRAMTPNRLLAGGEIGATSVSDDLPGLEGGFGNTSVTIRWELSVGKAPDVGWFESVAQGKGSAWPGFGSESLFVIKLTQPEMVESVEFGLEEVSRHPGIALNGGAALVLRPEGWRDQVRARPVSYREEDLVLTWERAEAVPPASPEDSGPDLLLGADGASALGPISLAPVKDEMPIRVRVADWGAKGKLTVRVKVEGIWENLPPRGPGASGGWMQIPAGADADGVPLDFEKGEGADDADGDGLTWAQEYRGVIVAGQHRRLSPLRREVFLVDPGGCLGEEERIALARRLSPWNVDLLFLEPGESAMECVRVIVLEDLREHFLPALLRLEDGAAQRKAFRAIRPRPECGALFIDGRVDPVLLAGDLALVLGLSDFGPEP